MARVARTLALLALTVLMIVWVGCTARRTTVTLTATATPTATPTPPQQFSLTTVANPPEGGTVSGAGTYLAGTQLEVHPQPKQGWIFKGWSGDCTGKGPCIVVMDSNKSVTANFVREFVLTTLADPPEAGTVSGGGVYTDGTKVEVQPQSNHGWMFFGWSGACSSMAPCVLIMDSDKTVTAHFTVG